MLEFRRVSGGYATGEQVLHDVSFSVAPGSITALIGTNGAGKSTALRMANGLLKPRSGEVLVGGVPTRDLHVSEIARSAGFLFQNPDRQICCATVFDELMFGLRALEVDEGEARGRVERVSTEFGLDLDAQPYLLNRGTRQMVALASVVVLEPALLVLDEPTCGLDFRECMAVMGAVRRLSEEGAAVLMVCHDMEVVADFAERAIVMDAGCVVDDGPVFEVLRNEAALEAASLLPPQIVGVSLGLARQGSRAVPGVATASTVGRMADALEAAVRGDVR